MAAKTQFYLLEISFDLIWKRKQDYYGLKNLAEVDKILQNKIAKNAWPIILGRATIRLHVCDYIAENRAGNIVGSINLLPYITFDIGTFAPITFNHSDIVVGYECGSITDYDLPVNFAKKSLIEVGKYLCNDAPKLKFNVDLDRIWAIENEVNKFTQDISVNILTGKILLKAMPPKFVPRLQCV